MSLAEANALTVVRREAERDVELKPMQFFRLLARLFHYTAPYKRRRGWLIFFVLLRSVQLPLLAWSIGAIISGPVSRNDVSGLIKGTLGFLALAAFTQLVVVFRSRLALELGEAVVCDLRNDLFARLQSLTLSFYAKTRFGRVISRFTSDIDAIRAGVQDIVFVSTVQFGQMLICGILMFVYDRVLFALILAMAPAVWFLNRHFRAKMGRQQREIQESFSRVTSTLAESVTGIRVTQGFVRETVNAGLFRDLMEDHSRYSMGAARTSAIFLPLLEMNNQIFIALLLVVGGYRLLAPGIGTPIGTIVQFFFLANLFFEPLRVIGSQYTQALTALVGAERVFRLLDTQPEWQDPPDAMVLHPRQDRPGIRMEFQDVSFGYESGRPVLNELNFVAEAGQTIALVGRTGSGKSSIINLITKSYLPSSGRILVDDCDIVRIESKSLRSLLGIVPQQNFLFAGTVLDNIRFARPGAPESEVRLALERLGFADLLEAMPNDLATAVGEGGSGLSLGQRQLVCFARAFLADPRILILDEATSAIDSLTESRIQNALAALLSGRTSFVVAHRLSTIKAADLILVLDHGRIVERGTHAELLEQAGVYHGLHAEFISQE